MEFLLKNLKYIMKFLQFFPFLLRLINRWIINLFASGAPARPHRLSLWSPGPPHVNPFDTQPKDVADYTSWTGLVDRTYTGRHLSAADDKMTNAAPDLDKIRALFDRGDKFKENPRSNVLFCVFAQWFTDSFLRTDPSDRRRTTSNHEINLCQIYGLDQASTLALRARQCGRLKSRMVNGAEYPALLYANGELDLQFFDPTLGSEIGLTYLRGGRALQWEKGIKASVNAAITDPVRKGCLYAAGLDRGSSTIAYSALNTIFLREHNRIAGLLHNEYPDWQDDQLFETTRLINIRQVLSVVVNDYIRHIAGIFPFSLDRSFAERQKWYRSNRISIEFNLLYRWHSLVPDYFMLNGQKMAPDDYRYNNALLERHGVEKVMSDLTNQPAGRIGLFNTPRFLLEAESRSVSFGREFQLQSFNKYRQHFGLQPYFSIDEMADGPEVAAQLKSLYGNDVNAVELNVGLFGEKRGAMDAMPETIIRMVAYDAFTHILTNPVLASEVYNVATFSELGMKIVQEEATLAQIVARNTDPNKKAVISFEHSP